jgi:hypothetical protein
MTALEQQQPVRTLLLLLVILNLGIQCSRFTLTTSGYPSSSSSKAPHACYPLVPPTRLLLSPRLTYHICISLDGRRPANLHHMSSSLTGTSSLPSSRHPPAPATSSSLVWNIDPIHRDSDNDHSVTSRSLSKLEPGPSTAVARSTLNCCSNVYIQLL